MFFFFPDEGFSIKLSLILKLLENQKTMYILFYLLYM